MECNSAEEVLACGLTGKVGGVVGGVVKVVTSGVRGDAGQARYTLGLG